LFGVRDIGGSTVKDDDFVGAWHRVKEEALDFGVVVLLDGGVVCEGGFGGGGLVKQDLEGVFVEGEGGFLAADVVDEDVVGHKAVVIWGCTGGDVAG
jgi:hypothetical protein